MLFVFKTKVKTTIKTKLVNAISPIKQNIVPTLWRKSAINTLSLLFVISTSLSALCYVFPAQAQEQSSHKKTTTKNNSESNADTLQTDSTLPNLECEKTQQKVVFKPQTIFDESDKGITFLHRWANAIHIDTKIITLENEASFFINKCIKTFADMAELERHLRSRKFLRDAEVSIDEEFEKITITTWDNWSLMPTVSFGRKGGMNTYSFGIKERN